MNQIAQHENIGKRNFIELAYVLEAAASIWFETGGVVGLKSSTDGGT